MCFAGRHYDTGCKKERSLQKQARADLFARGTGDRNSVLSGITLQGLQQAAAFQTSLASLAARHIMELRSELRHSPLVETHAHDCVVSILLAAGSKDWLV